MQILHVAREPLTGVWTVMKTLVKAQRLAGYRVGIGVFARRAWPHLEELRGLGVPFWVNPTLPGSATVAFLWYRITGTPIKNWLSELTADSVGGPTVVHYHNSWLSGAIALDRRHLPAVIQVATFHGMWNGAYLLKQPVRLAFHRMFARRLVNNSVRLVAVDASTAEVASSILRLRKDYFCVIGNGVDAPYATHPRGYRQRNDSLKVGHVGALDEGKGWRLTAKAVEQRVKHGARLHLTVAGEGPDAGQAETWCSERRSFATFLGRVPEAGRSLIPELDILCQPSEAEGLSMTLLEALAAGVVIIATPVGGTPSIVCDGVNGFLVERDPSQISDALDRLDNEREILSKMSAAGVQRYREHFTADDMRERYDTVYRQTGVLAAEATRNWAPIGKV